MNAFASFVAGRRTKWVVIAAWIVALIALAPLGAKLADVTSDDTTSFLPPQAESTKVQASSQGPFPRRRDDQRPHRLQARGGGLTAADKQRIASDAARIDKALPVTGPSQVPFAPGAPSALVSQGGDTAYTVVTLPFDFKELGDWGKDAREIVGDGGGGLRAYVTGGLGLQADFKEVFGDFDTKLLLATVILVLLLLGIIYRALVIALIPLVVVFFAFQVASGFIYLYADAGHAVTSNSTSILVVLMFGVGTDYCLLLVSRYREELQRVEDKHDAMTRALRRAGPALLASGCTVITAMLVLLLADAGSIHSLGPSSAIGVAAALVAGLTLLPALLTISGRRGFWPRGSTVAYAPDVDPVQRKGIWGRFGERVLARPGLALGATVALFAFFTLGLLSYKEDYSIGGFFKKSVESVEGFNALEKSFPAGALDPTVILIQREGGAVTPVEVSVVNRRVSAVPGVASVTAAGKSKDGEIAKVDVTFKDDPYSDGALARVDKVRDAVRDLPNGASALVGSGSAVQEDFNRASERDLRVIVPVALLVITLILAVLLEALVAPLVLIATVMASFFGTLGLSLFFFIEVQGGKGVDASLPTYAFIFLVALGVDYTIFLMSRVREEARTHGTREGTLRALSATGPVITSAGVILAGTFSVLMTLPVTFAFNIGFMVAVGILLDTFVVRTIMVPAAVEVLGDKVWWPSTAQGGGHALREHGEAESRPVSESAS